MPNQQNQKREKMNEKHYKAWTMCRDRVLEGFEELISDPEFDVNHTDGPWDFTLLHWVCRNILEEHLKILLAHPKIDVNPKNDNGWGSPFGLVCVSGNINMVKMMLNDPRIKVHDEVLYVIDYSDDTKCLEWMLILRGEELNLRIPFLAHPNNAQREMQNLICDVNSDREATIKSLCRKHRMPYKTDVAHLYALVLLVNKGYMELMIYSYSLEDSRGIMYIPARFPKEYRFFSILTRLPLELSMILCNRTYGSPKLFIPSVLIAEELCNMNKKQEI